MSGRGTKAQSERTDASLTLPQIAELSGIDYRTLHNWVKRGLISPGHQVANGSGTKNLFGLDDALKIYVLADLRRAGVEMRVLEVTAKALRDLNGELDGDEILAIGEEVRIVTDAAELHPEPLTTGPVVVYWIARAQKALGTLTPVPNR